MRLARTSVRVSVVAVLLAAAGCAPVTTGGGGKMSDGKPVTGLLSADNVKQEYSATINSPEGWQCTSIFGKSATPGVMTRTVPLTCNNGATGNLVLTGNQFQQQIIGSFALSNGQSGQVIFGRT